MSGSAATVVVARAPGRVNLIGDHTDYTGGWVMPMAIDRWTTVSGERRSGRLTVTSAHEPDPLDIELPVDDPATVAPAWGRYVAAVAAELNDTTGFVGTITTDVPVGAGLSSSAALEVATALALGARHGTPGDRVDVAQLCQRAEHLATSVPSGIMDQLVSVNGVAGHALLIDCRDLTSEAVPIPDDVEIVVRFVAQRTLVGSAYAERVEQCSMAEAIIGPLRDADDGAWNRIGDPVLAARARHVITENRRVRRLATALRADDLVTAGAVLVEGHESLRSDYACSTPQVDSAVRAWIDTPGVFGARMTGGGFGGCIVALTRPGTLTPDEHTWIVQAVDGASVI